MKAIKRLISVAAVATVLGPAASLAQDAVEIEFLHRWPDPESSAFFEKAIRQFEAENPDIKVEVDAIANDPYKDAIQVRSAADDLPDIFFSWSGEFAWRFARAGQVIDLSDDFYGTDWEKLVVSAVEKPYIWEGGLYGIPFRVNAKFMAYNTAIFDEHDIKVPETWSELLAVCKTLSEAGVTPIGYGNQDPWAGTHYLGDFFAKLVPSEIRLRDYAAAGEVGEMFTHPGYLEGLKRYVAMQENGCFNRGINALTDGAVRESFNAGRVAMYYSFMSLFAAHDERLGQDGWDFFVPPLGTDGEGDPNLITGAPDGFLISSKSKHPEAAKKLLQFLSKRSVGEDHVRATGSININVGAVNLDTTGSPAVIEAVDRLGESSGFALWLDTDVPTNVVEVLLPGGQGLISGAETPESMLAKFQSEIAKSKELFSEQ